MAEIDTFCRICESLCGMVATVEDGELSVSGRTWTCSNCSGVRAETIRQLADHQPTGVQKDRIRHQDGLVQLI